MSKVHDKKKQGETEKSQDEGSLGSFVQEQAQKWSPALTMTILLAICTMAILIRVFSVIELFPSSFS